MSAPHARAPSVAAALRQAAASVVRAPAVWVGVAVSQWALAKLVAAPVGLAVGAATEGFAPGTRPAAYERILAVLAELAIDEPSIVAIVLASLAAAAVVGALGWTLLSGGVIARYSLAQPSAELVGGLWLRSLPGVVVQTLWHFALRAALLVAAASAAATLLEGALWPVIGITLLASVVVLDVARTGVVHGTAAPLHPRTAWRAFAVALRTPTLLLPAAAIAATGLALNVGTLLAALWTLTEPGWLWAARAGSLLSLGLGLWRMAFIAHHAALAPPAAVPDPPP